MKKKNLVHVPSIDGAFLSAGSHWAMSGRSCDLGSKVQRVLPHRIPTDMRRRPIVSHLALYAVEILFLTDEDSRVGRS
jgi:hypothetical protein